MRPPFDSLSFIDWGVYSDWLRDHSRDKAANWSMKVSKALKKFEEGGAEPRMLLYHGKKQPGEYVELTFRVYEPLRFKLSPSIIAKPMGYFRGISLNNCYWIPGNSYRGLQVGSPADICNPWTYETLSYKYFKCIVRRSMGIRVKAG